MGDAALSSLEKKELRAPTPCRGQARCPRGPAARWPASAPPSRSALLLTGRLRRDISRSPAAADVTRGLVQKRTRPLRAGPLGDKQGNRGLRGPDAGVTPHRPLRPAPAPGNARSSPLPLPRASGRAVMVSGTGARSKGKDRHRDCAIALEATTLPARAQRSPKDTTAVAEGRRR